MCPPPRQSRPERGATMLRLSLFLVLLTNPIRTYVTDAPSFADRLDKLYEKLEKFTVSPKSRELPQTPEEKLYAKLERLNSLSPDKFELSDDDEELLSAMQSWGRISADQLDVVVKDLQKMRDDHDEEKSERLTDQEYGDGDDEFQDLPDNSEGDYPNDKDWDTDDDLDTGSTSKPVLGITPSAFTRLDNAFKDIVVSAVDPIAATKERPRILDESSLTAVGRSQLRHDAVTNMMRVVKSSKCLIPQPRWFSVRQLAPAADTVYMPPCVQLHRCAPDSGCCNNEAEVCAPIDGKYVAIAYYLHKADGSMKVARMLFFNHTQCACVSRETLQSTVRTRIDSKQYEAQESRRDLSSEGQNDWRMPTEEPKVMKEEPEEPTQMRRCTCPGLFLANMPENGSCSCVCDWPESIKRRDCLSLSRGKEHFGLRDRVCVANGDCNPPTCEYGTYDRSNGKCPFKRYRRLRYHARSRSQPEKTIVV